MASSMHILFRAASPEYDVLHRRLPKELPKIPYEKREVLDTLLVKIKELGEKATEIQDLFDQIKNRGSFPILEMEVSGDYAHFKDEASRHFSNKPSPTSSTPQTAPLAV